MTKIKKIIITGFLLIGLIGVGWLVLFLNGISQMDFAGNTNDYVVNFDELNQKLHIRAKTWGWGANNELVTLCFSPINDDEPSSIDNCTHFFAPEIYYKKKGSDSLLVYVPSASIPNEHNNSLGPIKIRLTELDVDEIRDYRTNYEKYGLLKATVYREK